MALTMSPSPTNINGGFPLSRDSTSALAQSPDPSRELPSHSSPLDSTLVPPASPYPQSVDPSPVESNGTASTGTQIDDDDDNVSQSGNPAPDQSPIINESSPKSPLSKIDTKITESMPPDAETNPQSVIHAPQHFKTLQKSPMNATIQEEATRSPSRQSESTIVSPNSPEAALAPDQRRESSTSPLNTDLPRPEIVDRSTPRAQTVQEAEDEWKRRSRPGITLADIPEAHDADRVESDDANVHGSGSAADEHQAQLEALNHALKECWILCNTLAGLSSSHRHRVFANRGKTEVQEQAWRSCWKLCQTLYGNREQGQLGLVLPTLEMCRDFCQALFEARQKGDEVADSVLRVSFELNNHLYNTHDRNLPSAFQERTLDFYVTLCHRLMKQRTSLPQETDALLRACWSLAETLFSLRQSKREDKVADEELLGSAVQACWELCDLFREGWTQVRPGPERSTPRATQSAFAQSQFPTRHTSGYSAHSSSSNTRSSSAALYRDPPYNDPKFFPPETPTTIFDDTNESPLDDPDEPNVPNILVLGPDNTSAPASQHMRWPSSASTLSGYSESSVRTSSTATAPERASLAEAHLVRIRILLIKTAMNAGFQLRQPLSPPQASSSNSSPNQKQIQEAHTQNHSLIAFVHALPKNAFGGQQLRVSLLEKYRNLIAGWPGVVKSGTKTTSASSAITSTSIPEEISTMLIVPSASQTRASPADIARAVQWMMRRERNAWLGELFRFVFGCFPDDAAAIPNTSIMG